MGKFNLNQLLNNASLDVSNLDTNRPTPVKVELLDINDLIPSDKNFYSVDNVAELKMSIEMFGVKQNLTVKPIGEGKYRIIAGHRRHRACLELFNEGKTEYRLVPCGIETDEDMDIKEQILLITTNSTARQLSDYEKMKQAEELKRLFGEYKKSNNFPGRVRDLLADVLNTSPAKIGRMEAVSKNLSDDFMEEFKGGNINISTAYELSGMSEDKQAEVFEEYKEQGGIRSDEVKKKKEPLTKPVSEEKEPPSREDNILDLVIMYFLDCREKIVQSDKDAELYDYILDILENS